MSTARTKLNCYWYKSHLGVMQTPLPPTPPPGTLQDAHLCKSRNQISMGISAHQMESSWCQFYKCCVSLSEQTTQCIHHTSALPWCQSCILHLFHQIQCFEKKKKKRKEGLNVRIFLDFLQVDLRLIVTLLWSEWGTTNTTYGRTKADFCGENNIEKDF